MLSAASSPGQGEISIVTLIALVWFCAVAGDVTSYTLGRRLGRGFLERHGPRLKITEERLQTVEGFFDRHGGPTILIGRFIGLVRALAPFIAGASKMELRRFLAYDIVGAGLWSALFCLLGYFFWQSLDTVEKYIGAGAAAFTGLVVIGLAIVFAVRLRRDPEMRARVQRRLDANPLWRRVRGPLGFAWDRLMPGRLGLELTTLLALAGVGFYTYFWLESLLGTSQIARLDDEAFAIADALYVPVADDILSVLTHLGSLPVTLPAVLLTAGWAIRTRRATREGLALIAALRGHLRRRAHRQGRDRPAAALGPARLGRGDGVPLGPQRLRRRAGGVRDRARPRRPQARRALRARRHRDRARRRRRPPPASTCACTTSPT